MKKLSKNILAVIIAFLVGFAAGSILIAVAVNSSGGEGGGFDDFIGGKGKSVGIDYVKQLMEPAGDLIVTKYNYKDVDTYENHKEAFGMKIPFTTDMAVFTYQGVISLGVDINDVKYDIDNKNEKIIITLPEPGIIANEIDASSFQYPFKKNSIFNLTDMEDYTMLIGELKERKAENVTEDEEIMKQVRKDTEKVMKDFLTSSPYTEDYKVEFK